MRGAAVSDTYLDARRGRRRLAWRWHASTTMAAAPIARLRYPVELELRACCRGEGWCCEAKTRRWSLLYSVTESFVMFTMSWFDQSRDR